MNVRSKWFTMAALTLTSAMVLSACGTNGNSSTPADSQGGNATAGSGTSGSTLTVAVGGIPTELGYPADQTANAFLTPVTPVLQGLLRFDSKGNLTPWLAKSWKEDAQTKTITFDLRQGVTFSDGTPFNASAVKWNIQQYINDSRIETQDISSMDVVNAHTITLHLKQWDSTVLQAVGFFIRYISPTAFKAHNKQWAYEHPVGTGPFVLENWQKGVSITYDKNPHYWQPGSPHVNTIKMLQINDPMTAANALKSGQVDLIEASNVDIAKSLISSGKYDVELHTNGIGTVGVGVAMDEVTKGSPFANVKVRQALSYAIDTKTIDKTFGKGYWQWTNQWGSPNAYTYNPNVQGYPYNPQKAKELLAQAGYPHGFKTTFYAQSAMKNLASAIAGYLSQVGIDAQVQVVDGAKVNEFFTTPWNGLMFHYYSAQPPLGFYMWRHMDPNGPYYSHGIIHPQDVLALFKQNQQATTPQEQKTTAHEIQKLVYDKYDIFEPLYVPESIYIKQKYVKSDGFGQTHDADWTPADVTISK